MQTLSTIRNLTPAATAPDFAVALLRAAVHEAPAAFLLVTRGGADVRVVYANKVMQELSNNLLADNTEIRLVDLPLLGIPVSNLLNEANAAGGSLERQLLTVTRNGQSKQVLQTQVKPLPESADYQLIQFTLLKPESSTGDRTGALAVAAAEASGIGHWQCELLSG